MKKKLPRIFACMMACLIAFNGIAFPKAKAAVVESALLSAALSTYLSATGFEFFGGGPSSPSEMNELLASELTKLLQEFAASTNQLNDELCDVITRGTTLIGNGVVRFSATASRVLSSFRSWLIEKLNLDEDSSVILSPSVTVNNGLFMFNEIGYYANGADYIVTPGSVFLSGQEYIFSNGTTMKFVQSEDSPQFNLYINGSLLGFLHDTWSDSWYYTFGVVQNDGVDELTIYLSHDSSGVSPSWSKALDADLSVFGEGFFSPVSVALPQGIVSAPDLEDDQVLVIDTGTSYDDEQSFIDAVLNGTVTGTLNPSFTIENSTTGDVVVPDEDEERVGILNWLKNIAQSVKALPKAIAEAVANLFAPDVALMTEIFDTFYAKFGFLSTLHDLGSDLLSINLDSEPPVVYIHLEDAEGVIDYGGTVKALDMSWYQRYKADGDRIMGGFLWLGFLWLLFKRAPAIINGGEMVTDYGTDISDGFRRRKR